MSHETATPAPLNLWLVDRSRWETGIDHCPRDRAITYHLGPHGYGWQRKAKSIPQTTGTLVHQPLAAVLNFVAEHDQLPEDAWVYGEAIQPALATYQALVDKRGLRAVLTEEDLLLRTQEQMHVLEGLVWAWTRIILPGLHAANRVLLVEEDLPVVIGCDCGLSPDSLIAWGEPADHDARGCNGVGFMTKGDCVSEARVGGRLRYDEFKTTGEITMNWEAAWPLRAQMVAGVLGAERKLGKAIDEVWVHGLRKGPFKSAYSSETQEYDGPKYQNSPLVYGYRRPAQPPGLAEDWMPVYEWRDPETGKKRKLGNDYKRTGLWELPAEYWAEAGCVSPLDYWTRVLAQDAVGNVLSQQVKACGPIMREGWMVERFARQLLGEERRVQQGVWALYELVQAGEGWASEAYQAALDTYFPMAGGSACHSYFGDTCPNLALCRREAGWEDPAGMGFVPRRPHHQQELEQGLSRGLLPAEYGLAEEGE